MSAQQLAVDLWKLLESAGVQPTMNSIANTLRRHKVRFTDANLRLWLDGVAAVQRKGSPQRRRTSAALPPHFSSTNAALPPHSRRTAAAATRARARIPEVIYNSPDSLRSSGGTDSLRSSAGKANDEKTTTKTRSPKAKKPVDTSWIQPVIDAASALRDRPLSELDPDGRTALARYHCLKFGGCSSNEHTNRCKASAVAAGLASMARHRDYGTITVGEYVGYARKVHESRNGGIWYDVWLIRAFVEFES